MSTIGKSGAPQTRRYSEEKTRAVRMVHQFRTELGTSRGTVGRVAEQIGVLKRVARWPASVDGSTTDRCDVQSPSGPP